MRIAQAGRQGYQAIAIGRTPKKVGLLKRTPKKVGFIEKEAVLACRKRAALHGNPNIPSRSVNPHPPSHHPPSPPLPLFDPAPGAVVDMPEAHMSCSCLFFTQRKALFNLCPVHGGCREQEQQTRRKQARTQKIKPAHACRQAGISSNSY